MPRKGPYIPWYPSDIKGDTALNMVSLSAYGLWHKLLYIMHEGEPYGHLSLNGKVIPPVNLARMCSCDLKEFDACLQELEDANIFSRTDGGVVYSRRMVRDHVRSMNARKNGANGGNPNLKSSPSSVNLKGTNKDNQQDNHSLGYGNGNSSGNGSEERKGFGETIRPAHPSPEFKAAWDAWIANIESKGNGYNDPEHAQMAMDDLAPYDERYAIALLDQATKSRWSGFHFSNTPAQYKAWLKAQNPTTGKTPTERSRGTIQSRETGHQSLKAHIMGKK